MKTKSSTLRIFLLTVLTGAIVMLVVIILKFTQSFGTKTETVILVFPHLGTQVYCLTEHTGLLGNHRITIITPEKKSRATYNETKDYIYDTLEPIFLRVSRDTLYVFSMGRSPVPTGSGAPINVNQIEIDNKELIRLEYKNSYETLGLQRIE